MQATQFVMAPGVEQDRLRAILPEGPPPCGRCFGPTGRKRLSRIPDSRGKRWEKGAGGWLSVGSFSNVPFEVIEKTTAFQGELLEIAFTRRKRPRSGRNTATAAFAGSSWSECGKGPSGGSGGGDPSVSERAVYRGKRRSNPLPTGVGERSGRI